MKLCKWPFLLCASLAYYLVCKQSEGKTSDDITRQFGATPLMFQRNLGQVAVDAKWVVIGLRRHFYLNGSSITVVMPPKPVKRIGALSEVTAPGLAGVPLTKSSGIRIHLAGGNPAAEFESASEPGGRFNWFLGNDPQCWITNVPTFTNIKAKAIYPGIDWVCYGNENELEYDFIVAPGADPNLIRLGFEGADGLCLQPDGSLLITAGAERFSLKRPTLYQKIAGKSYPVEGRYQMDNSRTVRFQVGDFDPSRVLVIDPVFSFSTVVGAKNEIDDPTGIAIDSQGNAYIFGQAVLNTNSPTVDAFLTKLSADGSKVIYSDYIGGKENEFSGSVAVDAEGNAYVIGTTLSDDFPIWPQNGRRLLGPTDAFVSKISPDGSQFVFSAYVGGSSSSFVQGSGAELGTGIALDSERNIYITGSTSSLDFMRPGVKASLGSSVQSPVQPNLKGKSDVFIAKIKSDGSGFAYRSYLGGSDADIGLGAAVDTQGNLTVIGATQSDDFPTQNALQDTRGGGSDAFVAKINSTGSALIYSTYLGGSGNEMTSFTSGLSLGAGIAVDPAGNAYAVGDTLSTNFPTANAFQSQRQGPNDGFVTKIAADGSRFLYSTYFGGGDGDAVTAVAVDATGAAYITGGTSSLDFPGIEKSNGGTLHGKFDAFVAKLNPEGSQVVYSTFLGGDDVDVGNAIAVDLQGNAYVAGLTSSTNFPGADPSSEFLRSAFITKIVADGAQVSSELGFEVFRINQKGQFVLEGSCEPNRRYALEFSSDLRQWAPLTEINQGNGKFSYADERALLSRGFYRLSGPLP